MPRLKPGDSVLVPKGTPTSIFQGSILDKDPFKKGEMGYDMVGKLASINEHFVSVEHWHHNSTNPGGIVNIPIAHLPKLKKSKIILGWDEKLGVCTVFDPDNLPQEGAREYEVSVSHEWMVNDTFHGATNGFTIWALSRKEALDFARSYARHKWGYDGLRRRASLTHRNQPPFSAKALELKPRRSSQ